MVGCRQRGAVITVVDPDAARRSLVAGELACPQPDCGGRLRVWSRALPRRVRGLDGTVVRATPDRARCRACRVSHVLLPAGWLPRRGYDVEIVGAALLAAAEGAGYRRAATRVDVPASTVRDWIHAARDGAAGLEAGQLARDQRPPRRVGVHNGDHCASLSTPDQPAAPALRRATSGLVVQHPGPPRPRQPLRPNRSRRPAASR